MKLNQPTNIFIYKYLKMQFFVVKFDSYDDLISSRMVHLCAKDSPNSNPQIYNSVSFLVDRLRY